MLLKFKDRQWGVSRVSNKLGPSLVKPLKLTVKYNLKLYQWLRYNTI